MTEKGVFKFNILGADLTLKSEDPKEHVDTVLEYVNQRIKELQSKSKKISPLDIAILCALNIADELIKLKKEKNMNMEKYSAEIKRINEQITEALK